MARRQSGSRRGRGRPPTLCREQILEKALDLVQRDGREALTMRAVAEDLGTGPMSLYTHVRNKDDLLEGVAGLAFERLKMGLIAAGSWQERIAAWMHSMRDQLLRHPELMELFGRQQHGSPLLLRTCSTLAEILSEAGLEVPAAVEAAQGLIWSVLGFMLLDTGSTRAAASEAPEVQHAKALSSLSDEERASIEPLVPPRDLPPVRACCLRCANRSWLATWGTVFHTAVRATASRARVARKVEDAAHPTNWPSRSTTTSCMARAGARSMDSRVAP
jgi:AcrR family transcriptional regulator